MTDPSYELVYPAQPTNDNLKKKQTKANGDVNCVINNYTLIFMLPFHILNLQYSPVCLL
jgi:hypothetical protein